MLMAKMTRQQDDLKKLLQIVSSKGMKITPTVKKSIKDLVKKELGDKTAMAKGGMAMVMKDGKKVPAYAADGVGKMNMGGMAKKKPAAKMMAGGMTKKKPAAKMMGGGMSKSSGYMYGGMAKKKPAAKKK